LVEWSAGNLTICDICGWEIGENTRHETENVLEGVCNVIDTRNDHLIGWKRKRLAKNLYAKRG
jgi:hypothetical protein